MIYAYTENFILTFSHDEVVYGKKSMLSKMSGDEWQQFANLRLCYGYMFAHPGKKLLFMGSEFGQWNEWNFRQSLDWHLLKEPRHAQIQQLVRDLNRVYRKNRALHEVDFSYEGFEWIDFEDVEQSVISFMRKSNDAKNMAVVVCNMTPVPRTQYRVGVPRRGFYKEIINTDALEYGGSGMGNLGGVESDDTPWHGRPHSISLTLPPLSALMMELKTRR
jgi:1,4-alpha-glucan branching enzyme